MTGGATPGGFAFRSAAYGAGAYVVVTKVGEMLDLPLLESPWNRAIAAAAMGLMMAGAHSYFTDHSQLSAYELRRHWNSLQDELGDKAKADLVYEAMSSSSKLKITREQFDDAMSGKVEALTAIAEENKELLLSKTDLKEEVKYLTERNDQLTLDVAKLKDSNSVIAKSLNNLTEAINGLNAGNAGSSSTDADADDDQDMDEVIRQRDALNAKLAKMRKEEKAKAKAKAKGA